MRMLPNSSAQCWHPECVIVITRSRLDACALKSISNVILSLLTSFTKFYYILAEGAIALSVTLSGGALFANGKLSQFPLSLIVKVIPALFMQASAQHYFSMCPTVLVIIWGRRWKFQAGGRPAERKSFHVLLLSIILISTFAESSPSWPSLVAIMNKGLGASLVLASRENLSAQPFLKAKPRREKAND